jgi:hypothetical protein
VERVPATHAAISSKQRCIQVLAALIALILLIQATPAIVFADGPAIRGVVTLVAATALGIVAKTARAGETAHLLRGLGLPLLVLLMPAAWMLVQLIPIPLRWSNPIWISAAEALDGMSFGHISIDIGATFIAIIRYLTAVGILVVGAATTVDRTRAEWLIYWLTAATAFLATMLLAHTFFGFFPLADARATAALHAASALGILLAAATTIRAVERYETRRNRAEMTAAKFAWSLAAGLSALTLCWLALILAAPGRVTFAAACGFVTIMLIVVTRRFALPLLATVCLAALAVIGAVGIVTTKPPESKTVADLTLRFAAQASPAAVSTAERMIPDNVAGTGGGTFRALLPIYRDIDDPGLSQDAPTTAAQIGIEMGRFAPWTMIVLALVAVGFLLRGALNRGRDSFYPTATAGCIVTLTLEAFVDASLLGTAIIILSTASLGLGVAQSASRAKGGAFSS